MAGISAATVVKLRKMSGQGMMDCKKALEEANGEGAVVAWQSPDGKSAALSTLCCETDFVSRSDDFVAMTEAIRNYMAAAGSAEGAESLLQTVIGGRDFQEIVTEGISKTGEKIQVGDYVRFKLEGPGVIGLYVHFNHKVGSMVQIDTSDEKVAASPAIKTAASDIAMHITASKPLALDVQSLDPQVVEKEKAIYAAQVTNKPPEIVKRIVEGKMKKFYADYCLTQQPFVKDDTKTVEQVMNEAGKAGGGKASIRRFVRFEVG
jgi:elongation factor Ts